ncbi:MAG: hypothetical protein MJZ13_00170 [Bacteroidales bacterium]|nr:hypothetical protein [Bacteroidales bacterium]
MTLSERLSHGLCEAEVSAFCQEFSINASSRKDLYDLIYYADKRIASNAAWILTRMPLADVAFLQDNQSDIINLAIEERESVTLRRLSLNILNRQTFNADDLRSDFLDYCLNTMASASETPGIRSLCIKLAYKQCLFYPELLTEFLQYIDIIRQQPMQPAVRSAVNNTLKAINKHR